MTNYLKEDQKNLRNHWTNFQCKELSIFLPLFWHLIPNNINDKFKQCFFKKLTVCIKGIRTRKEIRTHFKWKVLKTNNKNLNLKQALRQYIFMYGYQLKDQLISDIEKKLIELNLLATDDQKLEKLRKQEKLNYKKQILRVLKLINKLKKQLKFHKNLQEIFQPTSIQFSQQQNESQERQRLINQQKRQIQQDQSFNESERSVCSLIQQQMFSEMIFCQEQKENVSFIVQQNESYQKNINDLKTENNKLISNKNFRNQKKQQQQQDDFFGF